MGADPIMFSNSPSFLSCFHSPRCLDGQKPDSDCMLLGYLVRKFLSLPKSLIDTNELKKKKILSYFGKVAKSVLANTWQYFIWKGYKLKHDYSERVDNKNE